MTDGQTTNAKLALIEPTRPNWADAANKNFELLDAIVGTYFVINQLKGMWLNSTIYAVGDAVVDPNAGGIWQTQVAHTSSALITTFAQERAARPTYWSVFSSPARARGAWTAITSYALNDFIVSGSKYCVCIQAHISGTDFNTDLGAGKWSVLIDLASAGSFVLPILTGAADANKVVTTNSAGSAYVAQTMTQLFTLMAATSIGLGVLQATSTAAARTAIGAQIAGSYQLASAELVNITANGVSTYGLSLLVMADVAALKVSLGLGTAAYLNVGVGGNQIPQMTAGALYPAANGSLITNITNVLQIVSTFTGAVAIGLTPTPLDDTLPQNTEGDQFMSLSITPKSATSTLMVIALAAVANNVAAGYVTGALFRDTAASAFASETVESVLANQLCPLWIAGSIVSGSLSSTTFKFRAGSNVAAIVSFNGISGVRVLGGASLSGIIIVEYAT